MTLHLKGSFIFTQKSVFCAKATTINRKFVTVIIVTSFFVSSSKVELLLKCMPII